MILLVDIGNTRMKWALLHEALSEFGAINREEREFKDLAKTHWSGFEAPQRVLVSNVAGPAMKKSANLWIKRRWKVAPEFILAQEQACGVQNGYKVPGKLGVDRWAALIAAYHQENAGVCVIDCGTAITIDVLNDKGRHLGGLIIPGLALMAKSLIDRAPDIEHPAEHSSDNVALFACDTENAVVGGALYAAVSLLDRAVADAVAELGPTLKVLITGGDAQRIAPMLRSECKLEPNLVIQGLARIAEATECDT